MSRHRNQRLWWVSPEGDELFLDDPGDKLRLFALDGTGIPGVRNQVARTPNRDGETYLEDSFLDPRFLTARCQVVGVSCWEDEAAMRLNLAAKLNPKMNALGTLTYVPAARDAPDIEYEIDAIYERGLEYVNLNNGLLRSVAIVFRCPDPSWRITPANTFTLVVSPSGLSVPISVPLSFAASEETQVVVNTGHLESFPTITITPGVSGCTNPEIRNDTSGKLFRINRSFVSGDSIVIDMDAPTAVLNGVTNLFPDVTSDSEVWSIERGSNTIAADVSVGGATFVGSWFSRFLGV